MNYALDALWWRLQHPQVRDLAAVLTAPPLWKSGAEIPVSLLLGERGFRCLLDLDGRPERLAEYLPTAREHMRLGRYAEALLAFWLDFAPHSRLLAANVRVNGTQQGELDFVAVLDGIPCHIELCCKYLGGESGLPETLCGFNPDDTLNGKREKLQRQLSLSASGAGRAVLMGLGVNADEIRRYSIVRGMGFSVSGSLPECGVYAQNAWTGMLAYTDNTAVLPENTAFCRLHRSRYLAPARVAQAQFYAGGQTLPEGMYACLKQRPDGMWHETQRWMVKERRL